MPPVKFTEQWLAALQPGQKPVTYWDATVTGFCVLVGVAGTKTFYAMTRADGRKVRMKIGRSGARAPGGQTWTVALARRKAQEILGRAASGELATAAPKRSSGPTLRQGLELHVTAMQRRRRSERSVAQIQDEVTRYLAEWLGRPLVELTAATLDAACNALMAARTPVAGAVNPPGAATAKRLLAHISAIWTSTGKLHDLPVRNPAKGVTAHVLLPRQERVPDADLPAWLAKVQKLTPVRRDLHLFCLFSGLRSESARSLRWDDVDWERSLLHVRKAKGDRPYTIPLAATHLEILRRRQRENVPEFGPWGGDHGWVFPGLDRNHNHVQPVDSGRQQHVADPLPGLHVLRRTYNSVAMEIGIDKESREALMNHEGRGVNVRHYGVPQRWEYVADCQERIEAAMRGRLGIAPDAGTVPGGELEQWRTVLAASHARRRLGRLDKNAGSEVQSKKSRALLRAIDGGKKS